MGNPTKTEEVLDSAEEETAVSTGSAEEEREEPAETVEPAEAEAAEVEVEAAEAEAEPAKAVKAAEAEPAKAAKAKEKPEGGEGGGRGWRERLSGGVVTVTALVVLVVSLVVSGVLWNAYTGASDELDAQRQVRTRSAEFARAFLLYRKSDLDGWEKRLTALAAPDYRSAIGQAVKMQFPVITSLEADSQVTVREVFLNDFDGTVAKTMVVADTQVTSKDFVRTVTGMRLLVELNLVKGKWLVSGVGVLGIDDETMTDHKGNAVDPEKVDIPETAPTTAP